MPENGRDARLLAGSRLHHKPSISAPDLTWLLLSQLFMKGLSSYQVFNGRSPAGGLDTKREVSSFAVLLVKKNFLSFRKTMRTKHKHQSPNGISCEHVSSRIVAISPHWLFGQTVCAPGGFHCIYPLILTSWHMLTYSNVLIANVNVQSVLWTGGFSPPQWGHTLHY